MVVGRCCHESVAPFYSVGIGVLLPQFREFKGGVQLGCSWRDLSVNGDESML